MNKKIYKIVLVSLLMMFVLIPVFSYADGEPCPEGQICNPIPANSISGLVKKILEGVIRMGIPVVALAIIYSGFLFVVAQGAPEKISTAKQSLTYTMIGAGILLGSWAIAQLISETVLAL